MMRLRDRVGLWLLVPMICCLLWVTTADAFIHFWFTAGANQGGTCACPFSCTIHPMGTGDPGDGGVGGPGCPECQSRTIPFFIIWYP